MSDDLNLFEHTYIDNKAPQTLFLLHGTGGTKEEWLFLGDYLGHSYNLVGLEGNTEENGMKRFFIRFSDGTFDQESLRRETKKFLRFVTSWYGTHQITPGQSAFLGYSNGANMLLSALFTEPKELQHLALLHPMLPFTPPSLDLTQHRILLTNGQNDHLVSLRQQAELTNILMNNQAQLKQKTYAGGHEVSSQEMMDVVSFFQNLFN